MHFIVNGIPRTFKNSPRMFRNKRTGKSFPMPSKASADWTSSAVAQLMKQLRARLVDNGLGPISTPVNVCALFYRDRRVGDLDNFCHAVGDALQKAGVLKNDSLIDGWDGSRKLIDRHAPRVEITLTRLGPAPAEQAELLDGTE